MKRLKLYLKGLFQPNSLRVQLLSRSLLLIALLLIVIGLFQYVVMREFIYQNKASSIQNQISTVPPDVWDQMVRNPFNNFSAPKTGGNELPGSHDYGPNHPFFFLPDANVAVIDGQGNFYVVANSQTGSTQAPQLSNEQYQQALQAKTKTKNRAALNYQIVHPANGGEQLLVLQPIQTRHSNELVQVSVSTAPLQALLVWQLLTFLALSLLALVGAMFAFAPVLRKTLIPLSSMVDTVEQIDAGNLTERFPARQGQVEIDRLSESFNGMLERLGLSFEAEKEAKEQMRRFVADASHELRTPITSIHGFLEVLLRGAMHQPEQLQKSLKSMHAESERMKSLVQDLLLLAKLDRTPNIELASGQLDQVIRQLEPQLKLMAGNRKLTLRLESQLHAKFNEDKIKQVVLNLFHNAVQHTDPETGAIEISLGNRAKGLELAVRDNGSGIAEEHLLHVFDRFYRSDSSRTRKYGGAGLGLSISKAIVEAHGGTIRVESGEGQGYSFYVWLPVEN